MVFDRFVHSRWTKWDARLSIIDCDSHAEVRLPIVDDLVARGCRHCVIICRCSLFVTGELELLNFLPTLGLATNLQLIISMLVVCFEEFWGSLAHANLSLALRGGCTGPDCLCTFTSCVHRF